MLNFEYNASFCLQVLIILLIKSEYWLFYRDRLTQLLNY